MSPSFSHTGLSLQVFSNCPPWASVESSKRYFPIPRTFVPAVSSPRSPPPPCQGVWIFRIQSEVFLGDIPSLDPVRFPAHQVVLGLFFFRALEQLEHSIYVSDCLIDVWYLHSEKFQKGNNHVYFSSPYSQNPPPHLIWKYALSAEASKQIWHLTISHDLTSFQPVSHWGEDNTLPHGLTVSWSPPFATPAYSSAGSQKDLWKT